GQTELGFRDQALPVRPPPNTPQGCSSEESSQGLLYPFLSQEGKGPGCHDRAVLLYEYVGKRIVDLQHTEVPDAYRGRGIAKHLAKAALDFVVEENLKAHLTCWYIQKKASPEVKRSNKKPRVPTSEGGHAAPRLPPALTTTPSHAHAHPRLPRILCPSRCRAAR
uniref:Protein NATD1 n=1 Tax=Oryctolagus cuniculus TaxID=9986 RepID=G1U4U0_RABIT